jgi:hypothetical protein
MLEVYLKQVQEMECFRMDKPNWKKMYAILSGSVADALAALPETTEARLAREKLQSALNQAEELYLREEILQ